MKIQGVGAELQLREFYKAAAREEARVQPPDWLKAALL